MDSAATQPQVVVPKTLTWDKMSALYVWTTFGVPGQLRWFDEVLVRFEDEFESPDAIPADMDDIDVRVKYNAGNEFGSATEAVATQLGLTRMHGMPRLIELLGANNRTGYLKSDQGSLVWLIRAMYEVSHNVDPFEHRRNVIRLFWPVMATYFAAATSTDEQAISAIGNPFTLNGYQELIAIAGGGDDARLHLAQLNNAFESARRRQEQANGRAAAIEARTFQVPLYRNPGNGVGHMIETDDQRVAGQYLRDHSDIVMLVVRKRTGHFAIFVRGRQDLTVLVSALEAVEPGRWFYDTRPMSPLLLNGSSSRDAVASDLKPGQLIELIQTHHQHRSRRFQEELGR